MNFMSLTCSALPPSGSIRKVSLPLLVGLALQMGACGGSVASLTARPSPAVSHEETITVGGEVRHYLVFRPLSLPPQLVPLVVAIHGYTLSSGWMEAYTHFDDQATKGGFVVVYPEGEVGSWNAGSCCGYAMTQNVDDVGFIRQLVDRMLSTGHVDPKRVFVTGVSNGGVMAHRIACELSDRVSAIASVAGALIAYSCNPTHPISILELHGTEDRAVPYGGGFVPDFGPFPATLSMMKHWASLNGCAASPTVTQNGTITTSTWGGCRGGVVVVLDAVNGGGHDWFGCDSCLSGDPNATAVVWDFFSHLPERAGT
jgi:polyhydroxybutyrate depolymerase